MQKLIPNSWETILKDTTKLPYFKALKAFVSSEYKEHSCFPKQADIFAALALCPLDQLKVVILGQDPYHGPGQAEGLSFSVPNDIKHPPSLINIFKEIETDLSVSYPKSGNLSRWAKQGVMLLNATLTVRAHEPGSHQKQGWETFTDTLIHKISLEKSNLVFLLWGGFAQKKSKHIDSNKHLILSGGHPSPLSANRGYWFGNEHFSKCNAYLKINGKTEIEW